MTKATNQFMEIKISTLKNILARLFAELEKQGLDSITISSDYYWHIPEDQIYDPYHEPDHLDTGQLTDDWSDLEKISNGEDDPVITDFLDLSAIFRAIGDQG